jgi:hypothetical protein
MVDLIGDYDHATVLGLPAVAGELGATYAIPIIYVPVLMITHVVAFYSLVRPQPKTDQAIAVAVAATLDRALVERNRGSLHYGRSSKMASGYPGRRQIMPKLRAFIDHVKSRSDAAATKPELTLIADEPDRAKEADALRHPEILSALRLIPRRLSKRCRQSAPGPGRIKLAPLPVCL